jgi:multidrug transporter EmrE-like cation transporter
MLLYIMLAVLAGIVQIGVIYGLRVGFLKSFIFAIPFILLHQYLFLYNYTKAPNFIIIWFITAAITSGLGFLIGQLVFKDVLTTYQVIGIICIVAGMIFMKF